MLSKRYFRSEKCGGRAGDFPVQIFVWKGPTLLHRLCVSSDQQLFTGFCLIDENLQEEEKIETSWTTA